MGHNSPPGLFITGTDTEVGKTYVAALVARALVARGCRVGVYKPVASGCRRDGGKLVSDDAVALWEAAGKFGTLEEVCPQRFVAPVAPHLAARAEGRRVDAALLQSGIEPWRQTCDVVLVEGAGGLMSPLADEAYNADLAAELGYPLIVVARNALGTINATLQTLITAVTFRDGLPVAGVVLNNLAPGDENEATCCDPSRATNRAELEGRCVAPVLAEVAFQGGFDREVDWLKLARGPLRA